MYRKFGKRLLDIAFSFAVLPFILLAILVIAPLIWLEDKGSIFYNAPRLGKDGKVFNMYKFRSMYMNAPDIRNEDGSTYNGANDSRVTRTGRILRKTSLDEIPQFINVLKGDMSLVGPRPDLPDSVEKFYFQDELIRMSVLPGITGYSQAYFRNDIELHERTRNDIVYIQNLSFLLDFKIIIKSIFTVLLRKGIYRESHLILAETNELEK